MQQRDMTVMNLRDILSFVDVLIICSQAFRDSRRRLAHKLLGMGTQLASGKSE